MFCVKGVSSFILVDWCAVGHDSIDAFSSVKAINSYSSVTSDLLSIACIAGFADLIVTLCTLTMQGEVKCKFIPLFAFDCLIFSLSKFFNCSWSYLSAITKLFLFLDISTSGRSLQFTIGENANKKNLYPTPMLSLYEQH